MCRQKGEHIDIVDTSEFLSKLGVHEGAVVVGDVARDPSPLPVREGAVHFSLWGINFYLMRSNFDLMR